VVLELKVKLPDKGSDEPNPFAPEPPLENTEPCTSETDPLKLNVIGAALDRSGANKSAKSRPAPKPIMRQ